MEIESTWTLKPTLLYQQIGSNRQTFDSEPDYTHCACMLLEIKHIPNLIVVKYIQIKLKLSQLSNWDFQPLHTHCRKHQFFLAAIQAC